MVDDAHIHSNKDKDKAERSEAKQEEGPLGVIKAKLGEELFVSAGCGRVHVFAVDGTPLREFNPNRNRYVLSSMCAVGDRLYALLDNLDEDREDRLSWVIRMLTPTGDALQDYRLEQRHKKSQFRGNCICAVGDRLVLRFWDTQMLLAVGI